MRECIKEMRVRRGIEACANSVIHFRVSRLHKIILVIFIVIVGITICTHPPFAITTVVSPTESSEYEEFTYESLLYTFHNDTVINPHPFKYIRTPRNICSSNGNSIDPDLLILVKSDVTHFSYRMGIRSTWGNFSINSLKIVFLLGYSSTIDTMIKTEHERYHDLIQEDFVDAYRNNTYKTIMAFNWPVRFCPGTKYLFFVDDDYFVNVNAIQEFLKVNGSSTRHLAVGNRMDNARVFRYVESDWYMTKSEYPFRHYPPYISGGAMLLSMSTAMILQNSFNYVRHIYVDDVYLGIVAYLLNIDLLHDERFSLSFNLDELDDCLAAHNYGSADYLIQKWKVFLSNHNDHTVDIYRHQMIDILGSR